MIKSIILKIASVTRRITSNTDVTAMTPIFSSWVRSEYRPTRSSMFTPFTTIISRVARPQLMTLLVLSVLLFALGANTAHAEVRSADIEAVFGTAVEIRPPSAIVVASNSGLVTLKFNAQSDLRIGSNKAKVEDVGEGDRVVSTAVRDENNELIALRTLVRVANVQPSTKHVVGVVSSTSDGELSIQTRSGGVVDVLIPAGIDAPSIGDGITMVARLDRSSGILTAVGFELTRKTIERIQEAQEKAADEAESARLSEIAIDARSKHLSALDDAARAIKRVIDLGREDQKTLDQAAAQFDEIQRRFAQLKGIYESAARSRGEAQPLLEISGGLVNEIGLSTFTIVPQGEQDANPYSVRFTYDRDETTVELPTDLLREISRTAKNPQLLSEVRRLIDPGSELDVQYSIEGDIRTAESIRVRLPRLVKELETVLEHESLRAFHGVITLVEIDESLAEALGIVIASNDKQGLKVAAKVTDQTEITLDGRSSSIESLNAGQAVDIQFESSDADSISDITGSDITLRAIAIRARSSAPSGEDHISGIIESIEADVPALTIRPTDGELIRLRVGSGASIIRNGRPASLDDVTVGDLVVDATRRSVASTELTNLVVVARKNVKFSGTVTGIGRAPARLHVTGDNGQSINVLVTDDTWLIVDERRVRFESLATRMNIVSGAYSVTGRDGTFYNVATIIRIESPKVVRASGIITQVNVVEGTLTVLSGKSSDTRILRLQMPETSLGDNLIKDGLTIRSLLEIERGDRVDIVFYVLETGMIEKLSVVSDNFIQSRGTLIEVSENTRFVVVELVNGKKFEVWPGPESTIHLNGRQIPSLKPVADLLAEAEERDAEVSALVSELLFIRDSIDSKQGVIISIKFQIKVESDRATDSDQSESSVETTVSGVIEAIDGNRWVIDGQVFTVNSRTNYQGGDPKVGEVAVAVLISRGGGAFVARTVNVSTRTRR
ncbi:hypothetical protein JYU04_02020 [Dehalococcoides mccartyi]|nr:hypothetical protein [Dehalococcoides mccartyi]